MNTELYDKLSPQEKEEVLKILKDKSSGDNSSYYELLYKDYEEIPVDIETFLHDPNYLGKALTDSEGRFTVFPYWENLLKKIYPDPLSPATCHTLALTGAIGLGKSFEAVLVGLYELYRMLCLKNPYTYYHIQEIDTITFAVMNITLEASRGVAWDKMQQLLQLSPWFMSKGTISGTTNQEWKPPKGIELIAGSLSRHIIGRCVFWAFFDEISFQPNQDVEKQKEKARTLISTATARMQSRFMRNNVDPTILVLASSKRTDSSFMETYIAMKKKQDSKSTLVVDEPQWAIREDKRSEETFKVGVGNKFLENVVLPLEADEQTVKTYVDKGYLILDVPIGYYENFLDDIDIALTDIAGISTSNSSRYISGVRLKEVKTDSYSNPFEQEIIEVGNSLSDTTQYYDFFNMDNIPEEMMYKPLFIHLDMSISGDKTGIAGVWIKGAKPHREGEPESRDGLFQLAFHFAVKAPKGFQVSFEKNRQFIYWLKEQGFPIKGVSADTYQSYDLLQMLEGRGYETEQISVDRLKDGICLPYQFFKNVIYEKRILMYESSLLTEEIIGLERDNNSGKIDHTPNNGGINSKDTADAVCGALYNASAHIEEFRFDYGETLDDIVDVSLQNSNDNKLKQNMMVDFEEELKRATAFTPQANINSQSSIFGQAQEVDDSEFWAMQGILI